MPCVAHIGFLAMIFLLLVATHIMSFALHIMWVFTNVCKLASCKETFHPAWLQSISVRPLSEDALICLRATNVLTMATKIKGRDFYFM
jgi:hypothetical protein